MGNFMIRVSEWTQAFHCLSLIIVSQVNFTLVAGNMEDVFKIKTVNHTYGEVFVNAPLDRESVDRYLLKVRQQSTCSYDSTTYLYRHMTL